MFLVNGETDWLSSLDNSSLLILLLVSICWEPVIVDKYEFVSSRVCNLIPPLLKYSGLLTVSGLFSPVLWSANLMFVFPIPNIEPGPPPYSNMFTGSLLEFSSTNLLSFVSWFFTILK